MLSHQRELSAFTYANGLSDGNAQKSPLIAAAEKWIAYLSKKSMTMTDMGDIKRCRLALNKIVPLSDPI